MNQQKYRVAVRSTSVIGGAAFFSILIGLLRTKVVAVLLGPAGMGLINLYTSLISPISTIANMGFHTSGVRSIADQQNDSEALSLVVKSLRRLVWLTGAIGCAVTVLLSPELSAVTFNSNEHAADIAFLGIVVLFSNLSMGQVCLLQGTRRIADLARANIWGAVNAAMLSLPCLWLWGNRGITASLVLSAFAVLLTTWWFAKSVDTANVVVSTSSFIKEAKKLLVLGLPVMATAVQTALAAYIIRLIIAGQFGLEGVGIWSAAFTISGGLANFVLHAIGTDYYPRLVAASKNDKLLNEEVNTQLEVGLLLSLPALVATIMFAPPGIAILYSGKFDAAIPVLRWYVFGIWGRVVSWPLSYIMLARGRGKLFFLVELSANIFHISAIYYCTQTWGLPGTGVGFMLLYLYYIVLTAITGRCIAGTKLSNTNLSLICVTLCTLATASFCSFYMTEKLLYYILSAAFVALLSWKVYGRLSILTGFSLPGIWKTIRKKPE
ncbi:MAG: hypothetical protein CVV42_07215 [Candidatus Riflebacteria bacterium HGW-Riflebacteria-2]|jgi:PST family polysaccharide transporter|nr:MAG: hypothetical protein CVV42_07215 [Candidatus Riflebacteria bacterium HGW-Riflebacteria-2]